MKKLVLAAAAAPLAFVSTAAIAGDSASEDLQINATVLDECSFADLDPVNFGNLAINTGSGPDALLLTGTRYDSGQQSWLSCNYAARITIEGEPMQNQDQTNDGPDAGDFTDELHYRITWRSDNANDFLQANLRTTNGNTVSRDQNGAFHNNSIVNTAIAVEDNPLRPLSGAYTATATLSVGPV